VHGVSTRKVDDLVKALGMTGISKSLMSPNSARSSTRRLGALGTES
jgi:transposase-like protein